VDKPRGWTSHDVVKKARNLLGGTKVGHTGTLDPMATGVLVLLVGKATKSAKLFENDCKSYLAEITFGRATDTYDAAGRTIAAGNPSEETKENVERVIGEFIGEMEQLPPMYSAVKVNGKKLYELARAGKTIARKPRRVTITKIEPDLSRFPVVTLYIECSKGTYIRSLAHQLGERAGCPAHLSALRRTASGRFTLEDAVDFASIAASGDREKLINSIVPVPDPGASG